MVTITITIEKGNIDIFQMGEERRETSLANKRKKRDDKQDKG